MLTQEEEQDYARKLKEHNDLDLRRASDRCPTCAWWSRISRQYLGYGLPQGDLIQEGNVGLMKAVKRFDPDQGVRLVSYAMHWIKAEIHEYISEELAHGQGGHHQGPAQAVLQPALR